MEPNPSLTTVEKGVMRYATGEQMDIIVAIGGGSVIDCAKVMSAAVLVPWHPGSCASSGRNKRRFR